MTEPLHPFCWLPAFPRKILFLFLSACAVAVMCVLSVLGRGLETSDAPCGIVSFEFAGDLPTANKIIDEWEASGEVVLAGFHLGLDYLFLVLYPSSIALGCAVAIPYVLSRQKGLAYLGVCLAWAQIFTSLLDATENFVLFQLLRGAQSESLARLAWWCASVKFGLFIAGLGYVLLVPATLNLLDTVLKSKE